MATAYAKEYINNLFKENFLKSKTLSDLKRELDALANDKILECKYNLVLEKINDFVDKKIIMKQ